MIMAIAGGHPDAVSCTELRSAFMAENCAPSSRHQFTYQGRVVYEWDQTFSEVNLYVQVPPGTRAKELCCDIDTRSVKLGLKSNPPYLQGQLSGEVKASESFWTLDGSELTINLQKQNTGEPWSCVFAGHDLDPLAQQQDTQRLMLERFQHEHPGFDFSGATFNGPVPNPRTFMGGANVQ